MQIDYLEFSSPDLAQTQQFFAKAFGWAFVDYGPDYQEVSGAGIGAGIARQPLAAPLIVLKTTDLRAALEKVRAAGGQITQEIFDFPGGQRFQFREPGGTEMAVWAPMPAT